jgi:hypothetical protein
MGVKRERQPARTGGPREHATNLSRARQRKLMQGRYCDWIKRP